MHNIGLALIVIAVLILGGILAVIVFGIVISIIAQISH